MEFDSIVVKIRALLPKPIAKYLPRDIAVISISPQKSKELNRLYRKKDMPTNVLSFGYNKEYGEVLVCEPVIRKETAAAKNSYAFQMTWMIVHGMLHLGGIHHEDSDAQAEKSEALERKIMKKLKEESRD